MSEKGLKLGLFGEPIDFGWAQILLLLKIEEKYGIEIKDDDVDDLIGDIFDDFEITWKRSYIERFRDYTSGKKKEWAIKWLEENK